MPVSRKRACVQCRAAKARCSLTAPCTRCRERTLSCRYEQDPPASLLQNDSSNSPRAPRPIAPAPEERDDRRKVPAPGEPAAAPSEPQRVEPARSSSSTAIAGRSFNPGSPQSCWCAFNTSFASPSDGFNGGDRSIGEAGYAQAPALPTSTLDSVAEDVSLSGSIGLPWLALDAEGVVTSHDQHQIVSLTDPDPASHIPIPSVAPRLVSYKDDLLLPRQRSTPEGYFSSTALFGQIMSYPLMLSKGTRLPPFIFPRCMMGGPVTFDCEMYGAHRCLPEILAICSNMVQWFERKTQASSAFVWKTIFAENDRLARECGSYSRERKLEAMQAIVIYLLLLAQDPDSIQTNSALSLAETMTVLGPEIYPAFEGYAQPTHLGLDRKAWMLRESARRTSCIIYGIQLLLDIELVPCAHGECSGFAKCPLPCVRDLWEPVSNAEWAKRYREYYPGGPSSEVMLYIETLGTAGKMRGLGDINATAFAELSRWCSRLDDLGMLVWTAVLSESRGSL